MGDVTDTYLCVAVVAFFFVLALRFCWLTAMAWQSADRKRQVAATLCLIGAISAALGFLMLFLLPRDFYGTTHEPFWVDALTYGGFGLIAAGHSVKIWGTLCLPAFCVGCILLFSPISHAHTLHFFSIMLIGVSAGTTGILPS